MIKHTLSNKEILKRYKYLGSSINNHIEYIESYEQQKSARSNNKAIRKEMNELVDALLVRSNGICATQNGKDTTYVQIIRKQTPDDIILVYLNEYGGYKSIFTCEEFKELGYKICRNPEGKIDWIPNELKDMEHMLKYFSQKELLLIKKGYWFKRYPNKPSEVYDGDIFLGTLSLGGIKSSLLATYCRNNQKCYQEF